LVHRIPAGQRLSPGGGADAFGAGAVIPAGVEADVALGLGIGQVQSHSTASLSASVEGNLAWIADVGTVVKQGQVVARLDTAQLSLQRAS